MPEQLLSAERFSYTRVSVALDPNSVLTGHSHIGPRSAAALCLALLAMAGSVLADIVPNDQGDQGTTQSNQRSGEEVFQQACFSCHGTGFYGAPVIGDVDAWEDRLSRGEAALLENTLQGLNSMPARGGCAYCADGEIKAAIIYLINN